MSLSRRNFLQQSGLLLGMVSLSPAELLSLAKAEYQMKPLRRNVGVFTERGGTIAWLISPSGLVVVDTQFPEQSEHLIEEISQQSDRKLDLLINTHHHGDHSGGNIAYRELAQKIVAHTNSKANQERVAKARDQEASQLYPTETYDTEWSQRVGDEIMTLRYFGAGHTDGDSLVHFENANVVHMGDLVFNRRFPYIDKSSGASIANWIKVLKKARKTFDRDTQYVFGHAFDPEKITGTHEDLAAMENYLKRLLKFGKQARKAGTSLEELKTNTSSIPGAEEWQGRGIERSLDAVWQELDE
jgi:cyclase